MTSLAVCQEDAVFHGSADASLKICYAARMAEVRFLPKLGGLQWRDLRPDLRPVEVMFIASTGDWHYRVDRVWHGWCAYRERSDVRSLSPTKCLGTWPTVAEAKLKCELDRQRLRRWPGRAPARSTWRSSPEAGVAEA